MDSDQVRFILLLLGVALVLGIYFWDRYKRQTRHGGRLKMARNLKEPEFDFIDVNDDVGEVRVRGRKAPTEPYIDSSPDNTGSRPDQAFPQASEGDPALQEEVAELSDGEAMQPIVAEGGASQVAEDVADGATKHPRRSLIAPDLEIDVPVDSDYLDMAPELLAQVPRLIVQINVMSMGEPFSLQQVKSVAREVELLHADMQIFHRKTQDGKTTFSMASLVEPGTFPLEDDPQFSTPGLILFTQLPGVQDGLAIYADMLFTAERLGVLLNAVLLDERRQKLTRQSIEHTREGILEHRRQIQLLHSQD